MMINTVPASVYLTLDVMSWSNLSWSNIGALLIAVGLVATLLSSYRYLLVYMFGGMAYWLVVEGIQSGIVALFPDAFMMNIWHSYVIALSLTWLVPGAFLAYRYLKQPEHSSSQVSLHNQTRYQKTASDSKHDKYKEHTPIYNNYKPRFHN